MSKKDIRKPLVGPFTLIHVDGYTIEANSLDELRAICHSSKIKVNEFHAGNYLYIPGIDFFSGSTGDWICRDLYGQIVIEDDFKTKYIYNYYRKRDKQFIRAVELGLPIPGTRCRRGGYWGGYRIPRHKNTMTQNFVCDEDAEYFNIKGFIKKENLPRDAWEDVTRSDYYIRKSWKKNRRHQWKD